MEITSLADFSANLAAFGEILAFVVPVAVGLAGFFGIASLVFFSFIRKH